MVILYLNAVSILEVISLTLTKLCHFTTIVILHKLVRCFLQFLQNLFKLFTFLALCVIIINIFIHDLLILILYKYLIRSLL